MKFFFDNCISPQLAAGIRGFEGARDHRIVHLREMFNQDIPDVEWLDRLGREGGWIIISADERISRNPAEKLVWRESHLTTFFFAQPWSGDKFWNQAKSLVTWWPEIVRQARKVLSSYTNMEELIRIGAYRTGADPDVDRAIILNPAVEDFLRQGKDEYTPLDESFTLLGQILSQS